MSTFSRTPRTATQWTPTLHEVRWMKAQLAEEFPELEVRVTYRDGVLQVVAAPR
jgi:hypothetical protein